MVRLLGVTPGSVTPPGIINDINHEITVYIDQAVMASTIINVHPLRNKQTVSLSNKDIEKFLHVTGHTLHVMDIPKIITRAISNASTHKPNIQKTMPKWV